VAFIAAHSDRRSVDGLRWGVQPIWRVLTEHGCKIAPSTTTRSRREPRSARSVTDEAMLGQVRRVFEGSGCHYAAEKVWWKLHREGTALPAAQWSV